MFIINIHPVIVKLHFNSSYLIIYSVHICFNEKKLITVVNGDKNIAKMSDQYHSLPLNPVFDGLSIFFFKDNYI